MTRAVRGEPGRRDAFRERRIMYLFRRGGAIWQVFKAAVPRYSLGIAPKKGQQHRKRRALRLIRMGGCGGRGADIRDGGKSNNVSFFVHVEFRVSRILARRSAFQHALRTTYRRSIIDHAVIGFGSSFLLIFTLRGCIIYYTLFCHCPLCDWTICDIERFKSSSTQVSKNGQRTQVTKPTARLYVFLQ